MPPEQLALIKAGLITLLPDYAALSARFYAHLFAYQPELAGLFTTAQANPEGKFVDMLAALLNSLVQDPSVGVPLVALGQHHRQYGVLAGDYELVGRALLAALAETLGPAWTPAQQTAWAQAYTRVATAMQDHRPSGHRAGGDCAGAA
jgi:hemoglobin-like flavoprotein